MHIFYVDLFLHRLFMDRMQSEIDTFVGGERRANLQATGGAEIEPDWATPPERAPGTRN